MGDETNNEIMVSRIFQDLAGTFAAEDIKVLRKGGKDFSYLDWPAAIRRLDKALGPENWEFSVRPWGADALIGQLKVTLPNGRVVVRENVGGKPTMPGAEEDDRIKGAATDALKRCMMMFGVGLYLHDDAPSQPAYQPRQEPSRPQSRQEVGAWFDNKSKKPDGGEVYGTRSKYQEDRQPDGLRRPRDGRSFYAWVMKVKEVFGWADILKDIDATFGARTSYGYSKIYKDWTPEQVDEGVQWIAEACAKTDTYSGQFKDILQEAGS